MAQFAAALYLRSRYDDEAFSAILRKFARWTEKKSEFGPITLGSRLSYLDFEAYQAIIYNKSALVLNLLHDLLGSEVFFAGLKEFFKQRKFSAATTGQFRKVMEQVSGRDLGAFFSLWFYSHKLPDIRASYCVLHEKEGSFLRITVEQQGEAFTFPLWVQWQEGKIGKVRREMLVVERKTQEFHFPLRDGAHKIRFNPSRAVPGRIVISRG